MKNKFITMIVVLALLFTGTAFVSADGETVYKVPVKVVKANDETQESMAKSAFDKTATVVENAGKFTYTIGHHEMKIMGSVDGIQKVFVYEGENKKELTLGEKTFEFTRNAKDAKVKLAVVVKAMGTESKDLLLVFDWAKATKEGNDQTGGEQPANWAKSEVDRAVAAGLIPQDLQNGYKKSITREEFCRLAIKMMEAKEGKNIDQILAAKGLEKASESTFTDCKTPAVLAAKSLGITDGTTATTFDPNALLNREQAAKFLSATAKACGQNIEATAHNYSDLSQISGWAKPYVGYVYNIGVMKGSDNKFSPKDGYQRQQAFMTMLRLFDALK